MNITIPDYLQELVYYSGRLNVLEFIKLLVQRFPGQVTFSTSFSVEDQVIAHEILHNQLPVEIFTLDTGRLFPETYSTWNSTNSKYQTQVKAYFPDYRNLEGFITEKGPNAFYESVENRKQCCYIRKVEPLKRALQGNAIWITGLRAEHSPERTNHQLVEWDAGNNIVKYNPILHWTTEDVRKYIDENNVPYNVLHDKGFVSIGCAPCTRAIRPGEDFRAGRWWWEDASIKRMRTACEQRIVNTQAGTHRHHLINNNCEYAQIRLFRSVGIRSHPHLQRSGRAVRETGAIVFWR